MEQSVRIMLKKFGLLLAMALLLHTGFAQSAPELIFTNPVLEGGTDKEDGAVYRFANITTGIDGLLKIKKRSGAEVVLNDIDLNYYGWDKALQPQLGIVGNVPSNQNWWMQFELKFVESGTTKKVKLKEFVATSIDVDGDNLSIREYVQMKKLKSMAYSSITYLQGGALIEPALLDGMDESDADDETGADELIQGPVTNFENIDTAGTAVMATYTYENKDAIMFVIGATSGEAISNAGMRLNSLWFKSFSLAPQRILPVKLETFTAVGSGKNVLLNWKTSSERDFSHFVVERSLDAKNYSDVALVFANGGNGENRYSFKDKDVTMPAGIAYYRLRMVDEDGTTAYSAVCTVQVGKEGNLSIAVFPNPAASCINVRLPGAWIGKEVRLKLYSISGTMHTITEIKAAGLIAEVPVSSLPAGIYIVEAVCNGETAQQRLLKN